MEQGSSITISCTFGYDDNHQRSNNFWKVSPHCSFNFLLINFIFFRNNNSNGQEDSIYENNNDTVNDDG